MSSGSSSPAASGPSTSAVANGAPAKFWNPNIFAYCNMPPQPGIQPAGAPHQSGLGSSDAIPNDPFYTIQYINDPAWPSDLHLDPSLSNWSQWSRRLRLLCKRQGLGVWLEGTFTPP